MAHDVFISYASEDKPTADAACAFLEARGIRCWIAPRDILSGVDWSEAIVDAIESCVVFVLIFSSRANGSPQIKREVERAVNKAKLVVPFRIENVVPTKALEYFISTPHWLDALNPPLEAHLSHLGETIRLLLERAAPPDHTLPMKFDLGASTAKGEPSASASQPSPGPAPARPPSELRIPLSISPELLNKLAEWEERYLKKFGSLFGGDRLESEAPPATSPRLTSLAGFLVGGLGIVWNVWFLVQTIVPGAGTEEAYFFSLFPFSRFLNFAVQAFGLLTSIALVAGAHRASENKRGGLGVLGATSRVSMLAIFAWFALTMATLLLSSNWRRHLASSNRAEVTSATLKATLLPLACLGSVAYLAKHPQ